MHRNLMNFLVDPLTHQSFELESYQEDEREEIIEGVLKSAAGNRYPIKGGIPRFVLASDPGQQQVQNSFGFKWQHGVYDSPQANHVYQKWLVEKYGFLNQAEMRAYFGSRKRIMDLGTGSGGASYVWMDKDWRGESNAEWFGVDISTAIDVARKRLSQNIPGTHFIQADVFQLPFTDNTFDIIYSEGVLHHTPSTEKGLRSLIPLLKSGGEIMFYVYRKKGPIREFSDDYVRDAVANIDPAQVWEMMRPFTALAKALSDLHVEVDVPEDIPMLDIKAGRQDVQRLIYWNFIKLYWNEELSFDENNLVNFDWYHPRYAHRQTEEEIRGWCDDLDLKITHFHTQESGFTIRAIKG